MLIFPVEDLFYISDFQILIKTECQAEKNEDFRHLLFAFNQSSISYKTMLCMDGVGRSLKKNTINKLRSEHDNIGKSSSVE
ncbi:hypothetical protein RB195_025423 [Necator americanus]|uniref:Uncharacterized protein n=1 Tax=Necator americanus TaxID=51031 RepID=A0ABR1ES75_NECAM